MASAVQRVGTHEARRLVDAGAQPVEVLPEADHRKERLPGALSLPIDQLTAEATESLDRDRPLLVYCYDTQCDLSGRGAARLAHLGFADVYDYTGSKAAWLAMGWASEGTTDPALRAGARVAPAATCAPGTPLADLPEAGPGGVVLVVGDERVVLGSIDPSRLGTQDGGALTAFDVAYPGPSSVRPSITVDELGRSMDDAGESWVVVTTLEGVLLGIVERDDLHADR
jgi:rhodanese-related sulfurtransferase